MARTYKRDARGRFAGGGGSSRPTVTGGSLKARSAATRARRKLAGQDPADSSVRGTLSRRNQKGAVTRTGRAARAAGQANRTKISARPAGVVGRGGKVRGAKAKPAGAAPKAYGRGVDAAKVDRMLGRLRSDKTYQANTSRVRYAKQAAGQKTRQRAIDFLSKQAGFVKAGTSMGRTQWKSPDGLTREQATRNMAANIPKQPKRSTAKTGGRKIVTRADKRAQELERRKEAGSSVFARRTSTATLLGRQGYDGSTGRRAKRTAAAAQRQASRRGTVRQLRGTGASLSPAARVGRGRARQMTLAGGTRSTFGRFRTR